MADTPAAPPGSTDQNLPLAGLGALGLTAIVWGLGPAFTRSLSVVLGPEDHLALRYMVVAIIYFAALFTSGRWRIQATDWPLLVFLSFACVFCYNLGSAFGFAHVSAGLGALIIGTQPLLIALAGALVAKERLSVPVILGLVTGFAGTAVLVWNDMGNAAAGDNILLGATQIFAAGIAWAIYVVFGKGLIVKYGAFPIAAWSISLNALGLMVLFLRPHTFVAAWDMSFRTWLELIYMALFSTVIATVLWNFGVGRVRTAAAGAFLYLVPIIGVAGGVLVLGETVSSATLAGGLMIMLGVAITQFGPQLRR